jgi:hypothetical protein
VDRTPSIPEVAEVLARASIHTPWFYEAPVRHWIRQQLLLNGERKWWRADRTAFVLVAKARILLGIRQPAGWDSIYDPSSWVIISCCPICDRPVRQGRDDHTYCSRTCTTRAETIRQMIGHVTLRCWQCDGVLIEPRADQKYCNEDCRTKASTARRVAEGRTLGQVNYAHVRAKAEQIARETEQPRICAAPGCANTLQPGAHRLRKFCSDACKQAVDNLNIARTKRRAEARAAKLNGHANGHDHDAPDPRSAADVRLDPAAGPPGARPDQAGDDAGRARVPAHDATPGGT